MLQELSHCGLALLAGFIVGIVFTAIKLPLPAPPVFAGIVGILGIYLGNKCWQWLCTFFQSPS